MYKSSNPVFSSTASSASAPNATPIYTIDDSTTLTSEKPSNEINKPANTTNNNYFIIESDEEGDEDYSSSEVEENDELEYNSDSSDPFQNYGSNSSDDIVTNFTERNFTELMNSHVQPSPSSTSSPGSSSAVRGTTAAINLTDELADESVAPGIPPSIRNIRSRAPHRRRNVMGRNELDLSSLLSPWVRSNNHINRSNNVEDHDNDSVSILSHANHHHHHHHHDQQRRRNISPFGEPFMGLFGDMMFPLMQFLAGNRGGGMTTNSDVVFNREQAQEVMNAIPQITYRKDLEPPIRETSCAICLMDHEEQDMLRRLPCSHHFHSDCIDQWLKQQLNCPLCKQSVGRNPGEVQSMIEKHQREEDERVRESLMSPDEREKLRLERVAALERKQKRMDEQKKHREEQHLRRLSKKRKISNTNNNTNINNSNSSSSNTSTTNNNNISINSLLNITNNDDNNNNSTTSTSAILPPIVPPSEIISLADDDDDDDKYPSRPSTNNNNKDVIVLDDGDDDDNSVEASRIGFSHYMSDSDDYYDSDDSIDTNSDNDDDSRTGIPSYRKRGWHLFD